MSDALEQAVIDAAAEYEEYDRGPTEQACAELVFAIDEAGFQTNQASAQEVLKALKSARYFDLLEDVAEAYRRTDSLADDLTSLFVQALIEQKKLSKAIQVAAEAESRIGRSTGYTAKSVDDDAGKEQVELIGLLGRAYKQKYVDHYGTNRVRPKNLLVAIDYYGRLNPEQASWHGVNRVACVARAARDKIDVPRIDDPSRFVKDTAGKIRDAIAPPSAPNDWDLTSVTDVWDLATGAECCLAIYLETHDAADLTAMRRWLEAYVQHPHDKAFTYNSTLRQLTEVWQLTLDAAPGCDILPVLEGELLRHKGAHIESTSVDLDSRRRAFKAAMADTDLANLQARLGVEGAVRYQDWKCAESRAYWVCKIHPFGNKNLGRGTGFLIRGKLLADWLEDKYYVLTNDHVVSNDSRPYEVAAFSGANYLPLSADQAFVSCELGGQDELAVERVVAHSSYRDLDFSLLELKQDFVPNVQNVPPLQVCVELPPVPRHWRQGQRLYVIGHPEGADLAFSMSDNFIIDHEGEPNGKPDPPHRVRLHYRSPTEKGSSGSPVFNRQWQVVALHHAGGLLKRLNQEAGDNLANEGIWIESVRRYLENQAE